MNKELEEAKDCLKEIIQNTYAEGKAIKLNYLLNYIDNSISKQELRKDLKILQETKVDDKEKFWMKSGIEEYLKKLLEGK